MVPPDGCCSTPLGIIVSGTRSPDVCDALLMTAQRLSASSSAAPGTSADFSAYISCPPPRAIIVSGTPIAPGTSAGEELLNASRHHRQRHPPPRFGSFGLSVLLNASRHHRQRHSPDP